jgi:hypothetical protein
VAGIELVRSQGTAVTKAAGSAPEAVAHAGSPAGSFDPQAGPEERQRLVHHEIGGHEATAIPQPPVPGSAQFVVVGIGCIRKRHPPSGVDEERLHRRRP